MRVTILHIDHIFLIMIEEINNKIQEALKANGEEVVLYREIKNAFIKLKTSKNPVELTKEVEIGVLNKIRAEHVETFNYLKDTDKFSEARKEERFIKILDSMLPEAPNEDMIMGALITLLDGQETINKTDMKVYIGDLKQLFPTADGKLIFKCVKSFMK